jgi:hypothetical protein
MLSAMAAEIKPRRYATLQVKFILLLTNRKKIKNAFSELAWSAKRAFSGEIPPMASGIQPTKHIATHIK